MHDVLDIIRNVQSLYAVGPTLNILKDFERVLDELDKNKCRTGFIAQEVKKAMDKAGHSEFPVWSEQSDGMQELGEVEFITPLIKAVQELSTKVEEQSKRIEELENN